MACIVAQPGRSVYIGPELMRARTALYAGVKKASTVPEALREAREAHGFFDTHGLKISFEAADGTTVPQSIVELLANPDVGASKKPGRSGHFKQEVKAKRRPAVAARYAASTLLLGKEPEPVAEPVAEPEPVSSTLLLGKEKKTRPSRAKKSV